MFTDYKVTENLCITQYCPRRFLKNQKNVWDNIAYKYGISILICVLI